MRTQCKLLGIARSSLDYVPVAESADETRLKRLQRLKREMRLETIYCKPRTSIADKAHRIYPYLLRNKEISRADEVWCADITYVPMGRDHTYLCAVMDYPSLRSGSAYRLRFLHAAIAAGSGTRAASWAGR